MEVQVKTSLPLMSRIVLPVLCAVAVILSCSEKHEHIAPAVHESDSLPTMSAKGVSNLISDSGIISYKIVAEEWNIYNSDPQKWTFLKGLFLEKFDSTFHVQFYVQSDTAYCHGNRIWELRGRVVVLNRQGDLFETEELFWDMEQHEMWNTMYMCITMPSSEQQLTGHYFRSNEDMTKYSVNNSAGYMPVNDKQETPAPAPPPVSETGEVYYQETQRPSQADSRRSTSTTSSQVTRPQQDSIFTQ